MQLKHKMIPTQFSRDQTKDQKTLFRPTILAEMSAERLSVLKLLSVCLQIGHLSAEIEPFCRNSCFLPKEQTTVTLHIIGQHSMGALEERYSAKRKMPCSQKDTLSAERCPVCRKMPYRQSFGFGRNLAFEMNLLRLSAERKNFSFV